MTQSMGGDMSPHEFIIIGVAVVLPLITFAICFVYLIQTINRITDFIMAQKDIVAFNRISVKPVITEVEDKKKEKETRDWLDYSKIVNSGIVDDADVKRFGTLSVDQG